VLGVQAHVPMSLQKQLEVHCPCGSVTYEHCEVPGMHALPVAGFVAGQPGTQLGPPPFVIQAPALQ
jgi:hypothetical protein